MSIEQRRSFSIRKPGHWCVTSDGNNIHSSVSLPRLIRSCVVFITPWTCQVTRAKIEPVVVIVLGLQQKEFRAREHTTIA